MKPDVSAHITIFVLMLTHNFVMLSPVIAFTAKCMRTVSARWIIWQPVLRICTMQTADRPRISVSAPHMQVELVRRRIMPTRSPITEAMRSRAASTVHPTWVAVVYMCRLRKDTAMSHLMPVPSAM